MNYVICVDILVSMGIGIIGYEWRNERYKSDMGKCVKIGFVFGINGLLFFFWMSVNIN